jgi:hypothetical protein
MRILAMAAGAALALATVANAQDSAQHVSAAAEHASGAVGHLTAAGVKTAVVASVVPATLVGAASMAGGSVAAGLGEASIDGGADLIDSAGDGADFASRPLPIRDEVVVAPDPAPQVPYEPAK